MIPIESRICSIVLSESVIKMPTCKDCQFYTPMDEEKGNCSNQGTETLADRDSGMCPLRAFLPKD